MMTKLHIRTNDYMHAVAEIMEKFDAVRACRDVHVRVIASQVHELLAKDNLTRDFVIKKEWKQDCTLVDYNQLDHPLPFKSYTPILCWF